MRGNTVMKIKHAKAKKAKGEFVREMSLCDMCRTIKYPTKYKSAESDDDLTRLKFVSRDGWLYTLERNIAMKWIAKGIDITEKWIMLPGHRTSTQVWGYCKNNIG